MLNTKLYSQPLELFPIILQFSERKLNIKKLNKPQTTKYVMLTVEQSLKVFENRELRSIFRPKRYELSGNRKILYKVELLYFKPLTIIN